MPYDPNAAKKLLADAGYPNGFEVVMDCPNDRYVNDEGICQAVTAMLARVGVKVTLNAISKARYFQKAGPTDKYDSSFNLLGWTPGSFDSWNVLANIAGCRDAAGTGSQFNFGGYCNPKVDALAKEILVENDTKTRDDLIAQAFKIVHEDAGLIPLHQQALVWGVSKKVEHRPAGGQPDPVLLGQEAVSPVPHAVQRVALHRRCGIPVTALGRNRGPGSVSRTTSQVGFIRLATPYESARSRVYPTSGVLRCARDTMR